MIVPVFGILIAGLTDRQPVQATIQGIFKPKSVVSRFGFTLLQKAASYISLSVPLDKGGIQTGIRMGEIISTGTIIPMKGRSTRRIRNQRPGGTRIGSPVIRACHEFVGKRQLHPCESPERTIQSIIGPIAIGRIRKKATQVKISSRRCIVPLQGDGIFLRWPQGDIDIL